MFIIRSYIQFFYSHNKYFLSTRVVYFPSSVERDSCFQMSDGKDSVPGSDALLFDSRYLFKKELWGSLTPRETNRIKCGVILLYLKDRIHMCV